ncbi:hypothetical protein P832_04071 [Enterobacter kobei]|uniref:DUF1488 domain-containing protein n=1 Tax=Enterobacter kobei TaxID=208224 RepID=UPI00044921E9|nr:DUF1488 domain-containing protein [Enterobacter kobei]EUL82144.1 hypothetical protein P827_04549 [Enterobacter kobei]KDF66474.1 hypothetical protein P832_04071 [Enterobacter kobei]
MNQAIHFPDRESWDEDKQAVCFPVLVQGMQLTCAIHRETLLRRFGGSDPLDIFCENRWDLEEEASDLIRDQKEDDQGWVWLS